MAERKINDSVGKKKLETTMLTQYELPCIRLSCEDAVGEGILRSVSIDVKGTTMAEAIAAFDYALKNLHRVVPK